MTLKKMFMFLLLSLFAACVWAKPPKPPHGAMAPPPPPPPPLSPYAHIHIDMGHDGLKLDVDCGAQTSIKDCADVASSLLDKAADSRHARPPSKKR